MTVAWRCAACCMMRHGWPCHVMLLLWVRAQRMPCPAAPAAAWHMPCHAVLWLPPHSLQAIHAMHTMPCHAVCTPHHTMPCHAIRSHTAAYHTMPCHAPPAHPIAPKPHTMPLPTNPFTDAGAHAGGGAAAGRSPAQVHLQPGCLPHHHFQR